METTAARRLAYHIALGAACALFAIHLTDPVVGREDDLIGFTLVVVMIVTLWITRTDKEYLTGSIPLRVLMFFAGGLGLTSVFLRP